MCEGSAWETRPIEEVALEIIDYRGKSPRKSESGIPLVTAKIVKNGRIDPPTEFIPESDYYEWMRRGIPEPGDVVITTEAPLGEVAQLGPEKVALAQRLIVLRARPDLMANRFLKYALVSSAVQHQLHARATGTTVLGIKQSELRKVEIPIPPLPTQRRIAHILGTLDDKIELNRRMNRTLEALARAIFKSWFIDFDPVIDNAILHGKPIPDEFADRADVRREILARSQPSPPAPLPEVEGGDYRGGFEFSGLVETARELRHRQTPVEEIMWELLRDRRFVGLKFRRQHQIGDYIADFYCHEHKLVIELDGGIHRTQETKDAKRDAYLESLGLTVLRFPNDEVLDAVERVLSQIAQAADVDTSPFGRGGGEGVAGYRHLFPDSFQDSPLGKIPNGWEVKTLGEVISLEYGKALKASIRQPGSVPVYGSNGRVGWHNEALVSGPGIVVGRKGNPGTVTWVAEAFFPIDTTFYVVPADEPVNLRYLYHALRIQDLPALAADSAVPGLNRNIAYENKLVLPSVQLLGEFECACTALAARVETNVGESRTLAQVRDALLPRLLSGQLLAAAMGEARADD